MKSPLTKGFSLLRVYSAPLTCLGTPKKVFETFNSYLYEQFTGFVYTISAGFVAAENPVVILVEFIILEIPEM